MPPAAVPPSTAPSPADDAARDLARRVGATAVRWVRQNPPGGRWHTWMFTLDPAADAIGPRVEDLHLSPGSPTEYRVVEAVVRRTSGIRSAGRGLALAFPASLQTDEGTPTITPRHSGADPRPGTRAVLAVAVQLDDRAGAAIVVDADDRTDHPFDPTGADGRAVFPAPDVVPALLVRAVLGEASVAAAALPSAGRLRVQGWVASVIQASLEHGATSDAVEDALDAAPTPEDVRTATLQGIHDLVVAGALPGLPADHARWCGPELTARIVSGVYGRIPDLLRYADERWPRLGEALGRRTRDLLDAVR